MNKDIACGVRIAGHIAGIDLADGFAFLRNCRHVAEVGNMPRCANRENLMIGSEAHWGIKRPEVGVKFAILRSEKNELPSLIGGYRKGRAHLG